MLKIYAPYVEQTSITFEYQVPDEAEFSRRIACILEKYPYLVAEEDSEILGYAYASAFQTRAAYGWSAETSIYVKMGLHHKGVGTALYRALENYLEQQNVCNLCACIAYPNPPSISFHERFGYTTVAHFHASGYKLEPGTTWSGWKRSSPHIPYRPSPSFPIPSWKHRHYKASL